MQNSDLQPFGSRTTLSLELGAQAEREAGSASQARCSVALSSTPVLLMRPGLGPEHTRHHDCAIRGQQEEPEERPPERPVARELRARDHRR